MTPYNQTPEDGLRGLLRDKFEDYEPDAPEVLDAILDTVSSRVKRHSLSRFTGVLMAFGLLCVSYTLEGPIVRETSKEKKSSWPSSSVMRAESAIKQTPEQNGSAPAVSGGDKNSFFAFSSKNPLDTVITVGKKYVMPELEEDALFPLRSETAGDEFLMPLALHFPERLGLPAVVAPIQEK